MVARASPLLSARLSRPCWRLLGWFHLLLSARRPPARSSVVAAPWKGRRERDRGGHAGASGGWWVGPLARREAGALEYVCHWLLAGRAGSARQARTSRAASHGSLDSDHHPRIQNSYT